MCVALLRSKASSLKSPFYNADVIYVSETWFDCNAKNPSPRTKYDVVSRADRAMGSCGGVLILTKNCSLNSEIKLKEFSLLYVKFVLCYNNCRIYNALVKDTRKYHLERNRFSQIPCKNERSVVFDDLNYSNTDWQCFTRPGSDGAFYVFKISLIQLVDGLLHKLVITNSNKTNLREVNKNYFSPPLHFGDNQ